MHNVSYIHINQLELRRFLKISPPVHPSSQTHDQWVFVDITCGRLPFCLSSRSSKLMYDLLFVDIAFTQFPFPPTIPPSTQTYVLNSPSLGSPFFFISFSFDIIVSILQGCKGFFCTSVVSNISHMIIHLLWKMESL